MFGAGMVRLVDGDSRLAVIDGDIHLAADRLSNACACSAATGEAVDEETLKHQRASIWEATTARRRTLHL